MLLINLTILLVLDLIVGSLFADALFEEAPELQWGQRDPVVGFYPKPNVDVSHKFKPYPAGELRTVTNSQGLRADRDYSVAKPPGVTRIVVVGDSHTEGVLENEHTYPAQLEQLLNADGGHYEVLNGGVKRYSPYQSYLRLEHQMLQYDPDIVVAAFYVGNDLLDLLRFDDRPYLTQEGEDFVAHPPIWVVYRDPPLPLWSQHSFLYALYRSSIGYAVDRAVMLNDLVHSFGGTTTDAVELAAAFGNTGNRELVSQTLGQTTYFERYPTAEQKAFALLGHVVDLHRELAARDGHRLILLLIPSKTQVEPYLRRERCVEAYEAMGLGAEQYERADARLYAKMRELVAAKGIEPVDPLAALRAEDGNNPKYWWELHINVRGARVIARELEARVEAPQ